MQVLARCRAAILPLAYATPQVGARLPAPVACVLSACEGCRHHHGVTCAVVVDVVDVARQVLHSLRVQPDLYAPLWVPLFCAFAFAFGHPSVTSLTSYITTVRPCLPLP